MSFSFFFFNQIDQISSNVFVFIIIILIILSLSTCFFAAAKCLHLKKKRRKSVCVGVKSSRDVLSSGFFHFSRSQLITEFLESFLRTGRIFQIRMINANHIVSIRLMITLQIVQLHSINIITSSFVIFVYLTLSLSSVTTSDERST